MVDEAAVMSEFQAAFGTSPLVLGGKNSSDYDWLESGIFSGYGQQPLFHIDMYVTPTGVTGQSGKEIVMLGRPRAAKEAIGKYSELTSVDGAKLDAYFDETEQQLDQRFEVHHLPLCLTRGVLNGAASKSDYYWLTFNNVVIENSGNAGKKVLMTTYSQDATNYQTDEKARRDLEAAAEAKWRKIGFDVHLMDGMEDLAYGLGSVHCITKDLRRSSVSA